MSLCWDRLDVYIYDYFVKRNLQATAKAFQAEGKVSSDPVGEWWTCPQLNFLSCSGFLLHIILVLHVFSAIDAPGGFLFEWWSVFWDIFIARTNEKHSDVAASYIEASFKGCSYSILHFALCDYLHRLDFYLCVKIASKLRFLLSCQYSMT